jgi:hypothetical protein
MVEISIVRALPSRMGWFPSPGTDSGNTSSSFEMFEGDTELSASGVSVMIVCIEFGVKEGTLRRQR